MTHFSKHNKMKPKTAKTNNGPARHEPMQRRQSHRRPSTNRITLLPHPPRSARSLPPLPSSLHSDESDDSLQTLHTTLTLLSQLHVRHKNQHRSQAWFKSLNLLRRSLRHLYDLKLNLLALLQLSATEAPKQRNAEAVRHAFARESDLRSKQEGLQVWIREIVLVKCYAAFSAVVADVQFAPLGVVLMGVVGDVGGVVGLPEARLEGGEDELVRGGDGLGAGEVAGWVRRETGRIKGAEREVRFELGGRGGGVGDVDLGEIVARRDDAVELVADVVDDRFVQQNKESDADAGREKREAARFTQRRLAGTIPTPARTKRQDQAGKRVEKKSKKKSAIDDIFADFG